MSVLFFNRLPPIPFNEGLSMKRNGASRPVSACVFTGIHRAARAAPLLFERYFVYRPAGRAGHHESRRLRLGGKQSIAGYN